MSSDGNSTSNVEPQVLSGGTNRRGAAIAVLAAIAIVLMLYWAREVFIPVALALFISYLLAPPVAWLARHAALPTSIGAAITLTLVLGGMGAGIVALEPQAMKLLDTLPTAARKLDRQLRRSARDKESTLAKVKEAAAELERAAASATASATAGPAATPKATPAPGPRPETRTDRLFLVGTTTVLVAVVNAIAVIALVYLLLVAGDSFKRKLVKVSGDTLSEKKITVEILDEIDRQVQRYLVAHVGTSALLGVLSWGVFELLGLDNASFWAVAAAVLHLMPYVGSALTMVLTGLVAYLQFDDLQDVALVIGSQIAIAYLIGLLLLPWITERMTRINAVTVFVALLFWGWLWGVWGLLLGVPIMMTIKAVCERMEGLQPIAELMGYDPPKARPKEGDAVAGA